MIKIFENSVTSHKEFELINITDEVKNSVESSGITNGIVVVISRHTTAGITTNEALPCVEKDIELKLEQIVPANNPYVHTHMLVTYGTCSGNAPGHLKQMIVGNHCVYPVIGGKISLGSEQKIYFAEFDGLQIRKYVIEVIGE